MDEINKNNSINDKKGSSFDMLCKLQRLIKRESVLKELCNK